MRCKSCNARIGKDGVCHKCGTFTAVPIIPKSTTVISIISLVLSIVSIFWFGFPAALASIILALVYKNRTDSMNIMARAGLGIGIFSVVLSFISAIITAIFGIVPVIIGGVSPLLFMNLLFVNLGWLPATGVI